MRRRPSSGGPEPGTTTIDRRFRTRLSGAALLAANVVPLIGVLHYDWSLGHLLALYWAESGVIGLYNVLKMIAISPVGGIALGAFFTVHFGMFMFVHGVFLVMLIGGLSVMEGPFTLSTAILDLLGWEVLALAASHGVSFVLHWVVGNERKRRTLQQQMMMPYGRIIVMHLTILFGTFVTIAFGSPVPILVLFVVLKTGADLRAHVKEHTQLTPWPAIARPRTSVP